MSTSDYLERLKSIRNKYGSSHSTNDPQIPSYPSAYEQTSSRAQQYLPMEKNVLPESPSRFKSPHYEREPQGYSQPFERQAYGMDYNSRKTDRERQIEKIREGYANSRRKVIESFEGSPMKALELKQSSARLQLSRPATFERTGYQETSLKAQNEESISPIKRMKEFSNSKPNLYSHKTIFMEDRKLEQMNSNRQRQGHRFQEEKKYERPQSQGYEDLIKKYTVDRDPKKDLENSRPLSNFTKRDIENSRPLPPASSGKPEYSISNIERIQQRIHSVLGKK